MISPKYKAAGCGRRHEFLAAEIKARRIRSTERFARRVFLSGRPLSNGGTLSLSMGGRILLRKKSAPTAVRALNKTALSKEGVCELF
jgi:hypothetical protein